MKTIFTFKTIVSFLLLALGLNLNAQIKYTDRGFLTFGSTTSYHDGTKYYDLTLKGNIFVQSPANVGNFFQIDTNPAATRLASHLDRVVFYNTGTSTFNSIQVKNVYNYSDARAKANIQSLSQGLSILQQLRPVSYNFTDNSDNTKFRKGGDGKEIGLLAQEVEQVLPNIVLTDPDGNKLINYTSLIAVLIDAVKDLNEKVAALEAQQ